MEKITELKKAYLSYCKYSKRLLSNTIKAYQQDLDSFIEFSKQPGTKISEIGPELLQAFAKHQLEIKGAKATTVRRRIACLKTFFKWAKSNRFLEKSPFEEVQISIRTPKRLPRHLNKREVQLLTKAALPKSNGRADKLLKLAKHEPTNLGLTTYAAINLMTATGIRIGELVSITLSDINTDDGSIRIKGKGARERTVYVTNKMLLGLITNIAGALSQKSSKNKVLFLNSRGTNLTSQALRLRLKKLSNSSIRKKVTPHALRHTAATFLIDSGVDIRFVQKLLGHASINTTEIYTHVSDLSLKNTLLRVDVIGELQKKEVKYG